MRTWAWATTGTSAALLTTGTVLFILAKKDMTAAGNVSCAKFTSGEECDEAYDSKVSSARIKGYTAYALWGLGAAAAGAAVYMHVRASGARAGVMPWGSGVTAIVEW
jgi:hypothetical protein